MLLDIVNNSLINGVRKNMVNLLNLKKEKFNNNLNNLNKLKIDLMIHIVILALILGLIFLFMAVHSTYKLVPNNKNLHSFLTALLGLEISPALWPFTLWLYYGMNNRKIS